MRICARDFSSWKWIILLLEIHIYGIRGQFAFIVGSVPREMIYFFFLFFPTSACALRLIGNGNNCNWRLLCNTLYVSCCEAVEYRWDPSAIPQNKYCYTAVITGITIHMSCVKKRVLNSSIADDQQSSDPFSVLIDVVALMITRWRYHVAEGTLCLAARLAGFFPACKLLTEKIIPGTISDKEQFSAKAWRYGADTRSVLRHGDWKTDKERRQACWR